jgi:multidrug resistance efflux pump
MKYNPIKKAIVIIATTFFLTGCGGEQKDPEASANDSITLSTEARDSIQNHDPATMMLKTMGKVVAARFADLSFGVSLPIEQVLVKNGQQVHRGQTLATLDPFKLRNAIEQQQQAIEQAQFQIEQAELQMKDVIISQGYDPDKPSSIPANVRHNADVKSGYAQAKSQLSAARTLLAAAQHELKSSVLTAPFDGVVANLSVQAHQLSQPGQPVCRIIATGDMEVEFRVMESDLSKYQIGTTVCVIPVANHTTSYKATVHIINPVVDEQGAVTLRAKLSDAQGLFDGMNVEVIFKSL